MAQDSQTTADLGPALVRGIWAAVIIAVIIVFLRVFAKIKIRQFRVDDVLMIVSLVCASHRGPYRVTDFGRIRSWSSFPLFS
jgi:hypothetical protein